MSAAGNDTDCNSEPDRTTTVAKFQAAHGLVSGQTDPLEAILLACMEMTAGLAE